MNRHIAFRALFYGLIGSTSLCITPLLAQGASLPSRQHDGSTAKRGPAGEFGSRGSKFQDAKNAQLLAAAEPFEALTEQAFAAKRGQIEKLVAQIENAAHNAKPLLSQLEQQQLARRIAEVHRALNSNKSHEVALAAVEGYRVLVSATRNTKVPRAVSLLDYGGFRYSADLKSNPARWRDMRQAVQFAQAQWRQVAGRVRKSGLKTAFSRSLVQMAQAAVRKDAKLAQAAVTTEQALVDELESYFNKG